MKRHLIILSIISFAAVFLLPSCNECKDTVCLNGGACDDGTCICPSGYTGANCENEDRCYTNNIHCLNGGTCFDGKCDCPVGYTGLNCEVETIVSVSDHIGTYLGSWTCGGADDTVTLSAGTGPNQLLFFENDYGFEYYADFGADFKTFTIPFQEWGQSPDNYTVEGNGTIIGGSLEYSIDYEFPNDTADNFSCSFSGS